MRLISTIALIFLVSACAEIETKGQAFPKMYSESDKPVSIVVVR